MADGRHFANCYISISRLRIVRIWRNLVCRHKFWPRRRKSEKITGIPKFNMNIMDGCHIEHHFLAITRLHIVRLRQNLEFRGIIAHIRRLGDENVQFRKSNMVDGRHFENHYISISQPQIVPNFTKFSMQTQILPQVMETWQKLRNSQTQNGGWTPHWKSLFGYNSAAYCPIKMKFGVRRQNHMHTKQVRWSKCLIM